MFNVYELFKSRSLPVGFKRLTWKELLFIFYECPQIKKKDDMYANHNAIVFVVSGRKVLHRDGKEWLLTAGTLIFIKKGGYILERFEEVGWCAIVFYLPDDYLKTVAREFRKQLASNGADKPSNKRVIPLVASETTRSFYQSILAYLDQDAPPPEEIIELKFRELLLTILGTPDNHVLLDHIHHLTADRSSSLREAMEQNYMYNLALADYAKIAGQSLSSFKRNFEDVYAEPPGKWLLRRRLDHAKMLLLITSKNINEIAFESGFESNTHFIKVFKEAFELPPLQYRKQTKTVGLRVE